MKIKARLLSEPGPHNQSLRIPTAFTAHSQRVRRVPIASSEVARFYQNRDSAILGRTLVMFTVHSPYPVEVLAGLGDTLACVSWETSGLHKFDEEFFTIRSWFDHVIELE